MKAWSDRFSPRKLYRRWTGYRFDRRYGIDTTSVVAVDELGVGTADARHAARYSATSVGFLRHVFARNPVPFEEFVFVDLGSGKGRVVIEAASYPFATIIGVEFSASLHEAAVKFLASYLSRSGSRAKVDLQHRSATEFVPPLAKMIVYMYNPFDAEILRVVMKNIADSLRIADRRIVIVYLNPRWSDTIARTGVFGLIDTGRFGPDEYHVYSNRTSSDA